METKRVAFTVLRDTHDHKWTNDLLDLVSKSIFAAYRSKQKRWCELIEQVTIREDHEGCIYVEIKLLCGEEPHFMFRREDRNDVALTHYVKERFVSCVCGAVRSKIGEMRDSASALEDQIS